MIVMAGMIGVGKTTYAQKIAEALETDVFYESVDDNHILSAYYENPDKYAFPLQIHFLNTRLQSIKAACHNAHNVLDRSIYEDMLFTQVNVANGKISEAEYGIYLDLLHNMMEEMDELPQKAPHLLVYLSGTFDHILTRIRDRGRPYEQTSGNDYLYSYYQQLFERYDTWFENYDYSPKVKIDINQFDLIHHPEDVDRLMAIINDALAHH